MGLDDILGERRPLNIGITPETYRSTVLQLPNENEVMLISSNPRNAYGVWFERKVESKLSVICPDNNWSFFKQVPLEFSVVYMNNPKVDILVEDENDKQLGLELKFLKGEGSLIKPKSLIDALDFTNRSIYCIYLIDGPGWLRTNYLEYLNHWWEFTNYNNLEDTLLRFFSLD